MKSSRRSTAGFQLLWPKPGEAPPGFSNFYQGKGRMSVKNRKGGVFRLYDSLRIPLAALPKKHTLPPGQVVRRAPFAPSPCPRGVASETRGCGGLVPHKAFRFGNFGQRQAQQSRAGRKTAKGRRSTAGWAEARPKAGGSIAGLGGSQAKGSAKHRPGFGGSQAKGRRKHRRASAEATAERQGEAPPGFGGSYGQRQAKHRRASVTFTKARGGRPERFVKTALSSL